MEFKQTKRQVARGTRADAETYDKLFLFKNVALLRATYQVRLLLYRAIQEKKEARDRFAKETARFTPIFRR